jgi:exonuclease III
MKTSNKKIIVGDFYTSLSSIPSSSRQKLNREIVKLNQIDLTDVYRTFHPNRKEYTFLSVCH